MELDQEKNVSRTLLTCGEGAGVLHEKLLVKPKCSRLLKTERLPTSSVLQRLQSFLPQMAAANEKLQQQMETAPEGHFDIERVDEAQRVIEMDVALVPLDGSDREDEEDDEEDEEWSDDEEQEVTEQNIKLPGHTRHRKEANISVLEQQDVETHTH